MKLLIFEWGAYTQPDINACFDQCNITYRIVSYHFSNKNEDPFFSHRFPKFLAEDAYDAVFSVNYFPLVAQCCYEHNIKYLSWSYDNPLNVQDIEATLGLPTNYVFLFDKIQVKGYQDKGFQNVFHLPLAVNTDRLDQITLTKAEADLYGSEISFVGKLYQSPLGEYMSAMDEYCKGYLDSVCDVQLKLYGCYLLDQIFTEDFISRINTHYRSLRPDTTFQLTREALSYACAAQITRKERLLLLGLLSSHHQVKLYSREENQVLKNVQFMGSCGYLHQMPRIFKASSINLNITLKINQSGIPLRIMDILGSGGFLLSNFQIELAEYFQNEKEVILYESIEDAYAKADFFLKHPDLRMEIARHGYQKAREQFNYKKQLATLFQESGMQL